MRFIQPLVVLLLGALLLPGAAVAQSADPEEPTFANDVAPILYESCVNCHRPGEIAPMSLISYQEVRPWARSIKNKVETRAMPPWHLDRHIGIQKFKNDPSLTDAQIATIVRWVDNGAPQGNPADTPTPPEFAPADAWQIGEPDLVVRFPDYTVPAAGPDLFGNLFEDFDLEEDRYITSIQTRPVGDLSRQVVHHALSYAVEQNEEGESMGGGIFLVEYASGKQAEIYPPDSGLLLPGGTEARLSYHLHSIGEEVDAQMELGINFLPKGTEPKHIRYSKQLGGSQGQVIGVLDIPAGEIARSDGYTRFNKAARITMFQPHMHMLGIYQCIEFIYPTQPVKAETVNCASFDYNWHLNYNYADDTAPLIPAGTILHVTSWHDNSAANRANLDPSNWVGSGQRTIDEMGFAWIGWYDLTDEEYEAELAEREAARSKTND
ncbi:MAG: cytochrome c [Acidobacteria bacterium]|nr:cytochrome c [Acidobacteriota bacterium]MYD70350.1 cytochrome c [Acidobacteriota bacterium]MYJ04209.1 cytochrome c [Acidobacteriota bacterium]